MQGEVWGHVGLLGDFYQVSNHGNVRSLARTIHHSDGKVTNHKSKVLKQTTNHKGYKVVYPSFGGKKKSLVVHRLVAMAFVPNLNGQPEVNHKDEDKANNYWENLEWCDTAYNVEYSQAHVCELLSPEGVVVPVKNYSKFARENELANGKISMLVNKTRKSHKGWTLYEPETD